MDVLIIEDEQAAAELLKKLLFNIDKNINVISIIDSIEKSVEWLEANAHPDLIFLDIQLSDGLSFNIFKQVEVGCPIIFTTAYDQYALDAFETNSVDYLLKPISLERLEKSILKFEKVHRSYSKAINADMNKLLTQLSFAQSSYKARFLINKSDYSFIVDVADDDQDSRSSRSPPTSSNDAERPRAKSSSASRSIVCHRSVQNHA